MNVPSDFPWRAGMLDAASGDRMFNNEVILRVDGIDSGCEALTDTARPDLTDPATLGALLGAVREAYPSWFAISCQYRGSVGEWHVVARREGYLDRHDHAILGEGKTEPEALLAAWAKRPTVPR